MRPKKSSLRLGSCAKLAPHYCGPFEILSKIGQVAYQLELPPNLRVHNVFHIYVLKKYVHDATHVVNWNDVQVEPEGDFSGGTGLYARSEGDHTSEPHHWSGEGAMEAP